jgi:hypothetical protein
MRLENTKHFIDNSVEKMHRLNIESAATIKSHISRLPNGSNKTLEQ